MFKICAWLTFASEADVLELPHEHRLIDQVVLDDENVRLRSGPGNFLDMARVAFLHRWSFFGDLDVGCLRCWPLGRLRRATSDEEAERRSLAVL